MFAACPVASTLVPRASLLSKAFSLLICLGATKFVSLRVFTLIETIRLIRFIGSYKMHRTFYFFS